MIRGGLPGATVAFKTSHDPVLFTPSETLAPVLAWIAAAQRRRRAEPGRSLEEIAMKVFIACLGTETNTFSPIPTGRQSFAHGFPWGDVPRPRPR